MMATPSPMAPNQSKNCCQRHGHKVAIAGTVAGLAVTISLVATLLIKTHLKKSPQFQVSSYNTLAPSYASPERYAHLPDLGVLDWDLRQKALISEISSTGSDIICLQEVETGFFQNLQQELGQQGYIGVYTQKIGKPDGVATFFKEDAFTLVDQRNVFYELSGKGKGNWRPGQVLEFEYKGHRIGVVNTHLAWDPNDQLATAELDQLVKEIFEPSTHKNWIVCGDFNVHPGSSALEPLRSVGMESAHLGQERPSMAVMSLGKRVADKPDWIMYGTEGLKAKALKIQEIGDRWLPSPVFPSDHLALTSRFTVL